MISSNDITEEKIIKSRKRVKQHGEVFTPCKTVRNMIDLGELKELIVEIETTVLEPACGEGVFLVEILKKRLKSIWKESEKNLIIYENLALLSLTTLYGIELLEDNAQRCVINIYETFHNDYRRFANKADGKLKRNVLESAKVIISTNIVQGNFLTKMTTNDTPIIFSEWRIIKSKRKTKNIKVERTEFSLEETLREESQEAGHIYSQENQEIQLSMFNDQDMSLEMYEIKPKKIKYKYIPVIISNVYKEEMEEIHG